MMKRTLTILGGIVLAMLTACGGGGGGTPPATFPAASFTASSVDLGAPGTGSTQVQGDTLIYRHFQPDLTERRVTGTVAFFSGLNGTLALSDSTGVFQTIATTNNYDANNPIGITYTGLGNSGDIRAGRGNFIVLCSGVSESTTHLLLSNQYTRVTDIGRLASRVVHKRDCSLAPVTVTFSPTGDAAVRSANGSGTTNQSAAELKQLFSDQGIKTSEGEFKATLYTRTSLDFPGGDLVVVYQNSYANGIKGISVGRAQALP